MLEDFQSLVQVINAGSFRGVISWALCMAYYIR